MDNITHSLIGAAIGRGFSKNLSEKDRTKIILTSVACNNFPDLDFLNVWFVRFGLHSDLPKQVDYLLYHRGYTHTVILAPLFTGIALFLLSLFYSKSEKTFFFNSSHIKRLWVVGILGICTHIFLDFWNEYGVHPFWPMWSDWIYGDFVFIVEPLIWMMLLPWLLKTAKADFGKRIYKAVYALACLLLLFAFYKNYFPWFSLGLVAAVGLASFRWVNTFKRAAFTVGTYLLLSLGISLGVKQSIRAELTQKFNSDIRTIALTPAPLNLLCWKFTSFSETQTHYLSQSGVFSLVPSWSHPDQCYARVQNGKTVVFDTENSPSPSFSISGHVDSNSRLYLSGTKSTEKAKFKNLTQNCHVQAALHFFRVPFFEESKNVFGDLRFDFEPELGFAEFQLSPIECKRNFIPGWNKPLGNFF